MSSSATVVFQITHAGTCRGQAIVNTSYWRASDTAQGTLNGVGEQDLVTGIAQRWVDNFIPLLHEDYVYSNTRLLAIIGATLIDQGLPDTLENRKLRYGTDIYAAPITPAVNLNTGDCMPMTVAAVLPRKADAYGRRWRGRMKLTPIPENKTEDDKLTLGMLTDLGAAQTAYNGIYGTTQPLNYLLVGCIFSRTTMLELGTAVAAREASLPIVQFGVNPILGTQRSRKFKEPI